MSYTVRYTGTRQQKFEKALADAIEYLGKNRVHVLSQHIRDQRAHKGSRAAFKIGYFALSFAGIQGLPARAFIRAALRFDVG